MHKASKAQKLISVLATSALVTIASKQAQVTQATQEGKKVILEQVSCIHYLIQFQKDKWTII